MVRWIEKALEKFRFRTLVGMLERTLSMSSVVMIRLFRTLVGMLERAYPLKVALYKIRFEPS